MKLIQIADPHLSDKPPRYRTDQYCDQIIHKIQWAFDKARSLDVELILIPGDLFHCSQASRVSHNLVNKWLELLDESPCKVAIVAGNHDLAAGRIESISKQPIGTILKHSNVVMLGEGIYHHSPNLTIAGVSWNYSMNAEYIKQRVTEPVDVLVVHAAIAQKPNPFFQTIQPTELMGVAKVICYGHIHLPEQPYKVGNTTFINSGAISRGSLIFGDSGWLLEDSKRSPQIAFIDYGSEVKIEYMEVPHESIDKIFKLDIASARISEDKAIANFVSNLGKASVTSVKIEDLIHEISKMTKDEEVVATIMEVFQSIQT